MIDTSALVATQSMEHGAVVLLSGGMDSTVLLHAVKHGLADAPLYAISYSYGQKHNRELDMARAQAETCGVFTHEVVDISGLGRLTRGGSALTDPACAVPDLDDIEDGQLQQPPTYVPNRNMVLLSLSASWAESLGVSTVYYGAQAQDRYGYWDCTIDFVKGINDVLGLNRGAAVSVEAPFVERSKADIVRLGLQLDVDFARTWSCYRGGDQPCGTCPTCVERRRAFEVVGCRDPLMGAQSV